MKLTKDTLIEGKIVKKDTEIKIKEIDRLKFTKPTKELIESVAGRQYDDGKTRGTIAGISDEGNRPVKSNDVLLIDVKSKLTTFEAPDSSYRFWRDSVHIYHPWKEATIAKWIKNFSVEYVI